MAESHADVAIRQTAAAGAAAGDVTVTGIKDGDSLKSVLHFSDVGTWEELTDEFEITADDTINNDGGTSTLNGTVIVLYIARDVRGGRLDRS